ncbi:hypothetical protein ACFW9F_20150 [Streptomyces sp. NPDC059506]|uniref:hypothetical protein n=1 Tax=Streptomyces sp. NPDC059506 TaxID=3347751 RepID=UPI003684F82D
MRTAHTAHTASAARAARAAAAAGLAAAALAGTVLLGASPAAADGSPGPSAGAEEEAAPTEAGTTFRTATAIRQEQRATAAASLGDYLYWTFPAGAGQRPTVRATVTLPPAASRHGSSTWQLDLFDGLRRRQACASGDSTKRASADAESVTLSCTLRTVRPWSEAWSNDPLPGAYYLRLTAVDLPERDLGLPVGAEVEATARDAGGAQAHGGELTAPLLPVTRAGGIVDPSGTGASAPDADEAEDADEAADGDEAEDAAGDGRAPSQPAALAEPDGGWYGGWWSDRWAWTAAGGVLAALAGVAGHTLARGPRRPGA